MRCDYMLHQPTKNESNGQDDAKLTNGTTSEPPVMKQVEMNTIAAGFSYASTRMSQLHREVLKWTNHTAALDRVSCYAVSREMPISNNRI